MAWNTSFTRFYSSDLAGLECGSYLKIPRRDRTITKSAVYTGDLEKGQCVAMLRVPAGARIVGADLSWANGGSTAPVLAVGDPYACARLIGPVGVIASSNRGDYGKEGGHCIPWGMCGTMIKTGRNGDGCGLFYQYTCETDICITNLHSAGAAANGGFVGGAVGAKVGTLGAKFTGGQLVLTVKYLQAS